MAKEKNQLVIARKVLRRIGPYRPLLFLSLWAVWRYNCMYPFWWVRRWITSWSQETWILMLWEKAF